MLKRCISLFIILSSARLVLSETISDTEGISTDVVIQTDSIDGCTYQYNFLKAQYGTLDHCVDFSSGVTVCGFTRNNDAANLYNHNQGIAMGLGVQDFDSNAITATSFVQLTGVGALDSVSLQFQYLGDVTMEFKVHIYGSNEEGVCNPPVYNDARDSTWLGSGTSTDFITLQPSYKNFKYLCANAQEDSALVLLSQIRFDCPDTSVSPTRSPTLRPSLVPSIEPTPCHIQYYFAKLAIPLSGGDTYCQDLYSPDITVCGFDADGTQHRLYSTYQDDIPEIQQGLGLQNYNWSPGVADVPHYLEITTESYLLLEEVSLIDGAAIDMHGMTTGNEEFIFYGWNGPFGAPLSDIIGENKVLGTGNMMENQGKFVALDFLYKNYKYVIITVKPGTGGKVMLGQLRYDCFTPTLQPSFKSSCRPTNKPLFAPTLEPTSVSNPCYVPYPFLKVGLGIDQQSTQVLGYNGNPQVNIYGYKDNAPANLYSKDYEDVSKLDYGMGFVDSMDHEITSDGYAIYIEGLGNLENVALSMGALDSQGDNYAWAWYGTYELPSTSKDDVLIYQGSGADGGNKGLSWSVASKDGKISWKDFKFIKVVATKGQVLLASVRFECLTPTVQPSLQPTLWPSFRPITVKPSFRPTLMPATEPTQSECVSYNFDIPDLGIKFHSFSSSYPNGELTVYGYTAGTKALLYSQSGGLGFEDTVAHEITPGYVIYIEGLQSLEGVALSMQNMQGGDTWAWYGTDDFNSVDTPITFGSSDSGQLLPVTGSGKTWRDFKLIKVTALSGSVLLSGYQYCPPAKVV